MRKISEAEVKSIVDNLPTETPLSVSMEAINSYCKNNDCFKKYLDPDIQFNKFLDEKIDTIEKSDLCMIAMYFLDVYKIIHSELKMLNNNIDGLHPVNKKMLSDMLVIMKRQNCEHLLNLPDYLK